MTNEEIVKQEVLFERKRGETRIEKILHTMLTLSNEVEKGISPEEDTRIYLRGYLKALLSEELITEKMLNNFIKVFDEMNF